MNGNLIYVIKYIVVIQCVQAAIDHQLTTLARNNPSQRVAVVLFGDEVCDLEWVGAASA